MDLPSAGCPPWTQVSAWTSLPPGAVRHAAPHVTPFAGLSDAQKVPLHARPCTLPHSRSVCSAENCLRVCSAGLSPPVSLHPGRRRQAWRECGAGDGGPVSPASWASGVSFPSGVASVRTRPGGSSPASCAPGAQARAALPGGRQRHQQDNAQPSSDSWDGLSDRLGDRAKPSGFCREWSTGPSSQRSGCDDPGRAGTVMGTVPQAP